MINRVFVFPKIAVIKHREQFLKKKNVLLISILDSDSDCVFPAGIDRILQLKFDDIMEMKPEFKEKGLILFNEKHARKIKEFIDKFNKAKEDYILYVHCSAGVSRSGAVGDFANDYLHLDRDTFKKDNPQILPNVYILKVLRSV